MDSAEASSGYDAIRTRNQAALSALVSTDLELAHTFVEIAAVTGETDHRSATVAHAKNALCSLRRLFRWVDDSGVKHGFEKRADELETAISRVEMVGQAEPVSACSEEAQ